MGRINLRKPRLLKYVRHIKKRWILTISISTLLLIVLIQLFYPANRAVPFARIADEYYGFSSKVKIEEVIQSKFVNSSIGISVQGDLKEHDLVNIGAKLNVGEMSNSLTEYPTVMRFIPLSIIFHSPRVESLDVEFDKERLIEFSHDFSEANSLSPNNASVGIEDGVLVAQGSSRGYLVRSEELVDRVTSQDFSMSEQSTFAAPLTYIEPEVTDSDIEEARSQLEAALSKQIVISNDSTGEQFTPDRNTVASWLSVSRGDDGDVNAVINAEYMSNYLDNLNNQVGQSPESVKVTYRDGVEVERTDGANGFGVDQDKFISDVQGSIFASTPYTYISLSLKEIPPEDEAVYTYTNTEAGLSAKVANLTSRYNAKITVKQLNGAGWRAESRGSETWPSASTYKLYVAAVLFAKIESGEISWSDKVIGRTVSSCFESMIVVSTNECAEEWLRKFGRSSVESYIYSKGITDATRFTDSGPARTSTNDLVRIIEQFHDGSLASSDNTDRLFNAMGRQVWRKGIPSGSAGSVHDKVGFLWDYTHDAGVVVHPRGTYILAVMTKGHNYGTISQITKEIEQVMYP